MDDLRFLRPLWLAAIPAGFALIWALRRAAGRYRGWASVCDPALLPHLLVAPTGRRAMLPWWLMALAVVLGSIALAGPAFDRLELPAFRSLRARVVVLDVSRSMDAADLRPSRMDRARFKVTDILERSDDGRTGLVIFAGDAFVVAPLTQDAATLTNLLPAVNTSVLPVQGSRPDLGLAEARRLLEQGNARTGEIILVTDGVKGSKTEEAAADLAAAGFRVSVLAVGTEQGAPIPIAEGGFLKSMAGNIVVPRLDSDSLRAVASRGTGRFTTLTADDRDIDWLLGAAPDDPWRSEVEQVDRTSEEWRDEGPWLVLALLPLAALGFRRGWLVGVAFVLVLPAPEAIAFGWDDLWQRRDQQTAKALESGDPEAAARLAPDFRWRGTAQYRAGDYASAAESFSEGRGADDHYNRGNALARAGEFEPAIAAYDDALALAPGHADAEHNRQVVEQLLAKQLNQRGGGDGSPESGGSSPESTGGNSAQRRPEESDEPQSGRADGAESEGGSDDPSATDPAGGSDESAGTAANEPVDAADDEAGAGERARAAAQAEVAGRPLDTEEQLAYEQWLRRIPDDPGGLLRRKFMVEFSARGGRAPTRSDAW